MIYPYTGYIILALVCLLSACSTMQADRAPKEAIDITVVPDAVPQMEQRSKYGNPDSYEVFGQRYYVLNDSQGYIERGTASWYGEKFHGKRASSGETYNMYAMTAAHRTLPLPTYAQVTNLTNGRAVTVKINDRGPFHDNRIIDLSYVAAVKLNMLHHGTAPVEVRVIDPYQAEPTGEISPRPVMLTTTSPDSVSVQEALPSQSELQTATDTTKFYVQMGAFSNRQNAEMLRLAVANSGAGDVHLKHSDSIDGNTMYKVRVGPLASRKEAVQLKERLVTTGISGSHVVTE